MDSQFAFIEREGNFRWESDFLTLDFCNPTIQGFKDFIQLSSIDEILYYYYTVRIFKKKLSWDDDDEENTEMFLVSERHTHDFPCITQLKWILETLLNDDVTKDGQKILYTDGSIRFSKVLSTDGFACDDFYELTKSVNEDNSDEQFIFYCGTTYDAQGDLNSVGVRTPYLNRKDVESLLECVNGFINFSINEHNKWNSLSNSSYVVKNNRIYSYGYTEDGVDENVLKNIITIGDTVNIHSVINNEETCHPKLLIERFDGDIVFFSNGIELDSASIAYVSKEVNEEFLKFQEKEIIEDFLNILSDDEMTDFKNLSIQSLVKKYKHAIVNRTWMCREEHNFEILQDAADRFEALTPLIEFIISAIKEKLLRN